MMKWQPVSELTPEIVETAWRLIVWTDDGEWVFSRHNSPWGDATLRCYDGSWCVEEHVAGLPLAFITYFAVIDAPPES